MAFRFRVLDDPNPHLGQRGRLFIIMILFILACEPRAKIWDPTVPGKCNNVLAILIFSGSWNVFSDLAILLLPLYVIWRLQLPVKRKLGVSVVFAAGTL